MNFFKHSRPKKGLLISIEGNSGVGKTTLVKKLSERFSDLVIISEISDQIDDIPLNILTTLNKLNSNSDIFFLNAPPITSFFLLASLHFHLIESKIKEAMNENRIVICDRFLDSPSLLQSVILGIEKNKSNEEIVNQYNYFMDFFSKMTFLPDFTFVLTEDFSKCLERIESREKSVLSNQQRIFLEKTNLLWTLVERNNLFTLNQKLAEQKIIEIIENHDYEKSVDLDN